MRFFLNQFTSINIKLHPVFVFGHLHLREWLEIVSVSVFNEDMRRREQRTLIK